MAFLKDSLLVLQASTTKTADFQSTAVTAPTIDNDYMGKAIINVTACDDADADETYLMYLEDYDGTTYRKVGCVEIPAGVTGIYEIAYSGASAAKHAVAADIEGVRVNLDVSGTTPSITFEAFLADV
jgi:hypothetical protein